MKMKCIKLMTLLMVAALATVTFTACGDDDKIELPERTTVKYTVSISGDMLRFYDITINYLTPTGIERNETLTEHTWSYNETVEGRYYEFKFIVRAILKTNFRELVEEYKNIPDGPTTANLQTSPIYSAYFTNNTAANTYDNRRQEAEEQNVHITELETYLENNSSLILVSFPENVK